MQRTAAAAPLVSVGIPFFNEERFLRAAVESVMRQTIARGSLEDSAIEIILVDDGSRDASASIARELATAHAHVVRLLPIDGQRRFLAARLNEITRAARGRFVARMDADDVSHPERLARQLEALERGAGDAIGSWAGLVDESGRAFAMLEAAPPPHTRRTVLAHGLMPHPTLLAPRTWFLEHPYDESLPRTQDRDLWFRTVDSTRFHVIEEPLYVLRVTADEERFAPKYLESQRQFRTLLRKHGPAEMGWPATIARTVEAFAKQGLMMAAERARLTGFLARRRGRTPTVREREMNVDALAAVADVKG